MKICLVREGEKETKRHRRRRTMKQSCMIKNTSFVFLIRTTCSAQTVTRIGLLEEIPRSGVQIPCLLNGPLRRRRTLCYQAQTPVRSESSVDEHNLYFARSAIIGYLAVETWRVKTELLIITILHIIIITASILNHKSCPNSAVTLLSP